MFGRLDLMNILYSLPAVFLAFSVHEFAHAFTAYRMGDHTPKLQGRLTLDPLAHVDWIGLIMFLFFGFGWAKPVQVNPSNFKNRKWGDILVSMAGPISNLILAFFTVILIQLFRLLPLFYPNHGLGTASAILIRIMERIAFLNVVFSFLNMIPIPPFDGYKVVKAFFFKGNIKFFWVLERYSLIILFVMIMLNIFSYIVNAPSHYVYRFLNSSTAKLLGLF
ncbi:MAG: site-2 protease family protein [Caldicoprobacterales bacterium]